MTFIRGPKEKGCFLCRIVTEGPAADAANLVICRRERGILLLNRYPYINGHLLAAPNRHVGTLGELTMDERTTLLDLTCLGERLLQSVAQPHGFNMGINQGAAAGAGLRDHLHMHMVPRWEGDTNFMPVVGSVRVVPQALEEMHGELVAALSREDAG